ncbi:MAG: arabinogalactan endo-beta-1,4-galactanase [Gemmatimonadales bacterium]
MTSNRLRSPRLAASAMALALAALGGCSDTPAAAGGGTTAPAFLGADVSALERIEQAGGVFRDNNQAGDAIAILRAHGADVFRLRLFVNPNDSEVQVNDLAYTLRMAGRVKAAGARLLLDLHYSDTWADPGHQNTPAAWAALGFDSLEARAFTYTEGVITSLKQAGALPDIVQVGNEIDGGMLWPLGQVSGTGNDTPAQWDQFTRLLKAGISGVKSAIGPADTVRIMLHYSQGGSAGGTQWFFDHMDAYGVPYDIIGVSYYPWWHGTLADLTADLNATAQRYGKDVMVVETSYPWRAGGWESMAPNQAAMTWPVSPAGQAAFLRDLVAAVKAVPGGRGAGVVWWYPEAVQVPGLFVWGGGSLSLFDAGGNVLPAASGFGS